MKISEVISGGKIPASEARILLSHILAKPQEYLIMNGEENISDEKYKQFTNLLSRRENNEPIAYIIGQREFYSRDFFVDSSVLIPRPDSEIMIDAIIPLGGDLKILELGIGSGCLLLTLLLEIPKAIGEGVDISDDAINIALKNMDQFDLQDRCKIYKSNWFEKVDGKFDIIISNPPYINKIDQNIMSKDTILFEPKSALYAEENGLASYKKIASNAINYLNENGRIFLEIGIGQKEDVVEIFKKNGFWLESAHKDLGGIERVLVISLLRGRYS